MFKHRKTVIWGVILIAAGVLVALLSLGMIALPMDIAPWRIIVGILVLCVFIDELSKLDFAGSLLMASVELMIFEKPLGILLGKGEENWFSNWTVVLVALLVGGGLDLILGGYKKKWNRARGKHFGININSFSENLKYVDASRFKKEYVRNSFGEFELRFENADEYCGGGELTVENSFGEMTVYVPSEWEVEVDVDNIFGDLEVDDILRVNYADASGKKLLIKGRNRFGDMVIKAIR